MGALRESWWQDETHEYHLTQAGTMEARNLLTDGVWNSLHILQSLMPLVTQALNSSTVLIPSTPGTFTLCVWIGRLGTGSVNFTKDIEHEYTLTLPLGHPIPRVGDPYTPIPDGPILFVEEVQWESNLTPTLILRGEIDADNWAEIKEL